MAARGSSWTVASRRGFPSSFPTTSLLYFCPDRTEVQCRVAWRDGRHFGVQFIGDIAASTRRPV